ncbi:two-component sensor histidine kinase [Rhodovulum sp. 12E13]|uniref:ATP-binding protein n=1 Tax=Rhodovulum sp. 12E13 TaxID=2203891 RepID=UPI000E14E1BA|nr:ATP-binding protein [Rhodovulum sp. 12E13]RDC71694.1 two-component sensor histidine kinase [Rhodovulum sp. 12E13]
MPDNAAASLLMAVPMPLVLIGPDARIAAMNARARALFGADGTGRHHVTVLRQPALLDAIEAALGAGRTGEARYLDPSPGSEGAYRVTVAPVEAAGGVLVSFQDVTDLERATQMRRDFVANVSHELKTPLTALLGFIETLRGPARDDAAARERFLAIMQREAERMDRLVSDLLSLNRVESAERQRPTDPVALDELVASTVSALRPTAEAAGVELAVEGEAGERMVVPGDADQLTQVFANLIENGIKYGGAGGRVTARLTYSPRELAVRGPAVTVDVIDRGEGFDPIHIPRLTERFYRVDAHRSREKGGTGLGLAIAKHIVNRHRGRFRIESAPGQGATFTVTLPALHGEMMR